MKAKSLLLYDWSLPGSEVSDYYYKHRNQLTTLPGNHTAFFDQFLTGSPKKAAFCPTNTSALWQF